MFGQVGRPRPPYGGLHAALQPMAGEELFARLREEIRVVQQRVTRLA